MFIKSITTYFGLRVSSKLPCFSFKKVFLSLFIFSLGLGNLLALGGSVTASDCVIPVGSDTCSIPLSWNTAFGMVEVLVVGGGGGGASAGGGGGGGVKDVSNVAIEANTNYSITVGDGGVGLGWYGGRGVNGSASSFSTSIVSAGGGGGGGTGYGASDGSGADGASGGGGSYQGFGGVGSSGGNGGVGPNNLSGSGGGGGAGGGGFDASGASTEKGGNGGVGVISLISGASVYYGGGGGGGSAQTVGVGGSGGLGGGGNGGNNGWGYSNNNGVDGVSGTGGGAGGGASTYNGGKGGSGIVIIRYPVGAMNDCTGGTVTPNLGGYTIHTFTTVGIATFRCNGTMPGTTSEVRTGSNALIASANSNPSSSYTSGPGTITFNLINGGITLASKTVTAVCVDGSSWSGGICSYTPTPLTGVIAASSTCTILSGQSSCYATSSWSTNLRTVSALIVGGGGGGGGYTPNAGSGGGGGGGVLYTSSSVISLGQSYTVTVGSGGSGGSGGNRGINGGSSVFNSLTGIGGGGAGGYPYYDGVSGASSGGGSGGGGLKGVPATQGNLGSDGYSWSGGGGGGAGGVGGVGVMIHGGLGLSSSITGSLLYYAGGGAGGDADFGIGGIGGSGVGGSSKIAWVGGPTGNGMSGRGGGGAGVSWTSDSANFKGGNGGSGTVVISYPTGSLLCFGGTKSTSGSNTIHTFTNVGNNTFRCEGSVDTLSSVKDDLDVVRVFNENASTTAKLLINYGASRTFTLFNNNGQIAGPTVSVTANCANGTSWNATTNKCSPPGFVLTLSKIGTGSGSIPTATCDGGVCADLSSIPNGTNVVASNSPSLGSSFAGWSGGTCSGTGDCSFTMNANKTVTASYSLDSHNVIFNSNGGTGSMSNLPINYGASTNLTANTFTRVGYTFSGWNTLANGLGTPYGAGASYTMSTSDVTLFAQWTVETYIITTATSGTGLGTISGTTNGASLTYNTPVTLTASASDVNSVFDKWTATGAANVSCNNSTIPLCSFYMTGTANVTATFKGTTFITDGTPITGVTTIPGAQAVDVNTFTLKTSNGTENITDIILDVANASSTKKIEITSNDGLTVYGSINNPENPPFVISTTAVTLTATTIPTEYKVRITPKDLVNMPTGNAGIIYNVTAKVSNWTSQYNNTHSGSDSISAVVKIDNQAPVAQGDLANVWTAYESPVHNNWNAVAYGNGVYVAVADTGSGDRVMTSSDGVNWATSTSAGDYPWKSIAFGNGTFVAVGTSLFGKGVMTSTDNGKTWVMRAASSDNAWSSVTYGDNLFVAVAKTGNANRVMTSPDGINWTTRTSAGDYEWSSVAYGNGVYVAVARGGVMKSTDNGVTWSPVLPIVNNNWTSVTYASSSFVAVADSGDKRVMVSTDGNTWNTKYSASESNTWASVTYTDGLLVAVSSEGYGNRAMASSDDGENWKLRPSALDNNWKSVAYGDNGFVAVANFFLKNQIMTTSKELPIVSSAGSGKASVEYITPSKIGLKSALVLASTSPMVTDRLSNGTIYSVNDIISETGSKIVCIQNPAKRSTKYTCNANNLENGKEYYFKVFANYSGSGQYSEGTFPVGNSVTVAATSTMIQQSYRFYKATTTRDTLPGILALALQGNPATLINFNDPFRLLINITVSDNVLAVKGKTMKLQYAQKVGSSCDLNGGDEIYRDVTDVSPISFYATSTLGVQVSDAYVSNQDPFTNLRAVSLGGNALYDFSLRDNNAKPHTSYCIRVVGADGTSLDNYLQIPEIITADQKVKLTGYRFLKDDNDEASATFEGNSENISFSNALVRGEKTRLRMAIANASTSLSTKTYQIEYATNKTNGPWTIVPRAVDVTKEAWRIDASSRVADNGDTSRRMSIPSGKSFRPGKIQTFNNTTYPITLTSNQYTELEFSIRSTANVAPFTSYYFRVTNVGDDSDFIYDDKYPEVSVLPSEYRYQGGGGAATVVIPQATILFNQENVSQATTTVTGGSVQATSTQIETPSAPAAPTQSTTSPKRVKSRNTDVGIIPSLDTYAYNTSTQEGIVLGASAETMCTDMKHRMYYGVIDAYVGGEVSQLQYYLKQAGYFTAQVTGNYLGLTEEAVKAFQKDHNLIVTGVAGKVTRTTMKEMGCSFSSR